MTNVTEEFGVYDFGLTPEQEARASRLHAESLIIDMLFQGPCSYRSFSDDQRKEVEALWESTQNMMMGFELTGRVQNRWLLSGLWPQARQVWEASGITGGNRHFWFHPLRMASGFAASIAQFERLSWLTKAVCGNDFRRANAAGQRAGYINTQDTTGMDRDLGILDVVYNFGARVIGLTYNHANYVGTGCTDRGDGGVTSFGTDVIRRMNELGIIVDTAHCGRQTTLDACTISTQPVIASHTSAKALIPHDRAKSDEELLALARSGGVIGVLALPNFLTQSSDPTIEAMLDHIDYITRLVGWEHVGIGTDWPLQQTKASLRRIGELEQQYGWRPEHGLNWEQNLIGFDDYRDFPNITRGLVKRGYSDEQIRGILGDNFLRVVDAVCGQEVVVE